MKEDNGTRTNQEGLGSTYAGTQSPDANAPDGYQKPTKEDQQEGSDAADADQDHELGKEYDSTSSYGDKTSKPDEKGVQDDEKEVQEGSPIR